MASLYLNSLLPLPPSHPQKLIEPSPSSSLLSTSNCNEVSLKPIVINGDPPTFVSAPSRRIIAGSPPNIWKVPIFLLKRQRNLVGFVVAMHSQLETFTATWVKPETRFRWPASWAPTDETSGLAKTLYVFFTYHIFWSLWNIDSVSVTLVETESELSFRSSK